MPDVIEDGFQISQLLQALHDNHIEFFNPGGLPDTISIQQLLDGNYVSETRNKKLAAMFKEAGVIEKYGSGIKRIQQQFIAHNLQPPVFENFQHGLPRWLAPTG